PGRAPARRSSDPDLRPRLRPDDTVHRPLAGARALTRLRPREERQRAATRRRVRRRRRDRQRLAGRQGSRTRAPRPANRREVRLNDPALVRREYADESGLAARMAVQRSATGPDPYAVTFDA